MRAQASEVSEKKPKGDVCPTKLPTSSPLPHMLVLPNLLSPASCASQTLCLPHDKKLSTLRSNNLCMNCLKPGHFIKGCQSSHRCKRCQKPHHTLLHLETQDNSIQDSTIDTPAHNPGAKQDTSLLWHMPLSVFSPTCC